MRSILLSACCLVALLCLATVSHADGFVSVWSDQETGVRATPAWYGNTGLVLTPTAQTVGPMKASLGWHRISGDADDTDAINLNVGVLPGVEIGASRLDFGSDKDEVFHGKVVLPVGQWLKESSFPALAIGAWDISNELNRAYYLVLSKNIELGPGAASLGQLAVHVGLADNDFDEGALDGFFGGVEFNAFKRSTIQLEHDGEDFNAALRWVFNERLSAEVGSLDGEFGFGLTYGTGF